MVEVGMGEYSVDPAMEPTSLIKQGSVVEVSMGEYSVDPAMEPTSYSSNRDLWWK